MVQERVDYLSLSSDLKPLNFQWMISPFTRIGGKLGNKPFTDYSLSIDVAGEEFVVAKK
jgi:hypothetical protein